MSEFFTARELDELRLSIYPAGATLALYRVLPVGAPTLLETIMSGFHVQRRGTQDDGDVDNNNVTRAWIAKSAVTNEANLRDASMVQFSGNDEVLRYEVEGLTQMQQIGGGWLLKLAQIQHGLG